ncbi:MAG: outer membrane protein assembly factor BamB [Magnetococcales bacterium]|nr:outer membrane protein assembly factor BamB [Magnetococcales bacterium]
MMPNMQGTKRRLEGGDRPLRLGAWPLLWMVLMGLMVGGCSSFPMPDMPDFFSLSDDDEELQKSYTEPKPGKPTPLKLVWDQSISGAPEEHMEHAPVFAVDGDDLFVGTHHSSWVPHYGRSDGRVTRFSRKDGDILWSTYLGSPVSGGVAVDAQQVYAGTVDGEMVALSRRDGKVLWRQRVSTTVSSAPTVAQGRVIFTTLDNRTYALSTENGKRAWVHSTLPEQLVVKGAATPTVFADRVFVGYSSGEVFVLAIEDGRRIWTENLTVMGGRSELDMLQDIDASITVTADQVFAVNHQGILLSLFPDNGSRMWERRVSAMRRPLFATGRLFISDTEGYLIAMDAMDGTPIWRTQLSDGLLTAPVMFQEQVIVADNSGRIFSVEPLSGRVTGLSRLNDPIHADPILHQDNIFIWTNDGDMYRFN